MRRKITHVTPSLLIEVYRKASTVSATNPGPASALAFAANQNLITMTVGLLTAGPMGATPTSCSNANRASILRECDERLLTEQLYQEIEFLKHRIDRRCLKTSKVCENYVSYFEQYSEFDPFITLCDPSNPCTSRSVEIESKNVSLQGSRTPLICGIGRRSVVGEISHRDGLNAGVFRSMNCWKIPLVEINFGSFWIRNTQARISDFMRRAYNCDSIRRRKVSWIKWRKSTMNSFRQVLTIPSISTSVSWISRRITWLMPLVDIHSMKLR